MNGRLDRDFMFENHTIGGLEKVTLYVTMACLCTLGTEAVIESLHLKMKRKFTL